MQTFFITRQGKNKGEQVAFKCPYCDFTIAFYGVSISNICGLCYQNLPFNPYKMVRNQGTERKEYHVNDK
jgi:hypothetical protein